jgi:hypothetical protein
VKKTKREKEDEGKKYVVYHTMLDRVDRGVYFRLVHRVDSNRSIVLVDEQRAKAHIVPNENVFDTHDEAAAALAGKGALRWVVCDKYMETNVNGRRRTHAAPVMFQGRITTYVYGGKYRRETRTVTQDAIDGKIINVQNIHSVHVYETKKDAEADFVGRWRNTMKEAMQQIADWQDLMTLLQKSPPRDRKKKGTVTIMTPERMA